MSTLNNPWFNIDERKRDSWSCIWIINWFIHIINFFSRIEQTSESNKMTEKKQQSIEKKKEFTKPKLNCRTKEMRKNIEKIKWDREEREKNRIEMVYYTGIKLHQRIDVKMVHWNTNVPSTRNTMTKQTMQTSNDS